MLPLGVLALSVGVVANAQAAITATSNALEVAQAIASGSVSVTGASFVSIPPANDPAGTATTVLGGFPIDGSSYGVMSTGRVSDIAQPGGFADTSNTGGNIRGDSDYDVVVLKVDFSVPSGANCLSFNFKFLSEEYPRFVGSAFNDAFVAELDSSTWTTSGSTIAAANNFAFDSSGDVVSINSTGLGGMTPAAGAGTAFDGTSAIADGNTDGAATTLLQAATPISSGTRSLYLSLFDQGDDALDSAVFIDNLRLTTVANPAEDCKPGAVEAARLTLSKSVVNTGGGTASSSDWTLTATGPTSVSGAAGSGSVTNSAVAPGVYELGESGPVGYSAGSWSCTGGSLAGSTLTLAAGQSATCAITNTFIPPTATPSATPTATPSATPTATPSATPTATPSATPTMNPTNPPPAATPSSAPTPTPTTTPAPTPTPTPAPTATAAPTPTPAGAVAGATGTPSATLPSTDAFGGGAVTSKADVRSILVLIILSAAAILTGLVTPAPQRARRQRDR